MFVVTFYMHGCARYHDFTFYLDRSLHQSMPVDEAAVPDSTAFRHYPQTEPSPVWIMEESVVLSEAEALEDQMLRAGILASLQDAPEDAPDAKVEVPKSSVSSLRLVLT